MTMAARREANVRAIAGATLLENTRGYNGRARVPGLIHAAVWDDVRGLGLSREAVRDITVQQMRRAGMDKKYDLRVLTGGPGDGPPPPPPPPSGLLAQIRGEMQAPLASDARGGGKAPSLEERLRGGTQLKPAPPQSEKPEGGARSAHLAALQGGRAKLKPAPPQPGRPKGGAPSAHLAALQGGRATLKPAKDRPDKSVTEKPVENSVKEREDIRQVLSNKLDQMRPSLDEDTDSDSGDDDWLDDAEKAAKEAKRAAAAAAAEQEAQRAAAAASAQQEAKRAAAAAEQKAKRAAAAAEQKAREAEEAARQDRARERAENEKRIRDAEAAREQQELRERAENERRARDVDAEVGRREEARLAREDLARPTNDVLRDLRKDLNAFRAGKESAPRSEAPPVEAVRDPEQDDLQEEGYPSDDDNNWEGSEASQEEEESVPLTTTSPEWKSLVTQVENISKAVIDVHFKVNGLTQNFTRLRTGGAAGSRDWLAAVCKEIPTAGLRSLLPYAAHWHNEVWPTAFEASTRRDAQEAILHLVDGRAKPEAVRAAADAVLVETQARGFYAEAAAWLAPR